MNTARRVAANGWAYVVVFLLTRAWMVHLWRSDVTYINGDVGYYYTNVTSLGRLGIEAVMREYPTPVVWGLAMLTWLSGQNWIHYAFVFGLAMFLLDAGFTWLLWRHGGARRRLATAYWLLFVPLVGPLLYFRFDLLPAVLAGAGLMWLANRPRLAGGLIGLGAATKLWPALLIAPMLAPRRSRVPAAVGFGVVGFGLAALSLLLGGWQRLVSPLTWQKDRGLQVESLVATPLMVMRTFAGRNEWTVWLSKYNAFEIKGPGDQAALTASTVLTLLGFAVIVWLCVRLYRGNVNRDAVGLVVLAIVAIMIVTNKTLSPQYIVWLAGPLAVLLGRWDTGARGSDDTFSLHAMAFVALGIAYLTQLVYPMRYDEIVQTASGTVGSTLTLAGRNLLLLVWTVWVLALAARAASPSTKERASLPTTGENR